MSKVKIEGNASGTGTLTISAPNTNTDRTLTLPDTAGEFVTADSSGNVGIGTDSPDKRVTVRGSSPAVKVQEDGSNHYVMLEGGGSTAHLKFYDELRFSEGTTERMRIDSNGRVLINATGIIGADTAPLQATGGSVTAIAVKGGSNNYFQAFYNTSNSLIGSITGSTGSTTSYNTSSDYRLKENVVDMTGAIDRVKALQPRRFNWIEDEDDTTVDGFIAHEVSDVIPEAITGEKDATKEEEYEVTPAVLDDDGNVVTEAVMGTRTVPDYQGIDQSKLVPLLTGALQEAIAKIEALETRIETLENA